MDINLMLNVLRQELADVDRAILALEKLSVKKRRGRPPSSIEAVRKRRARTAQEESAHSLQPEDSEIPQGTEEA
jgi:hypothetical protein